MTDPQAWISLATLFVLEVVLGIDNIIFLAILVGKLPAGQQQRARRLGLGLAMLLRIALLLSLAWLSRLTTPLFEVLGVAVTVRTIILVLGGLFLIGKSTFEIHERLEGEDGASDPPGRASFGAILMQILVLDLVFSFDSVITAVGMAQEVQIMIAAVVMAVLVMMFFAGPVGNFVDRHPTVKMLALSFLLLIGVTLIADGLGQHIPKGYIYFAMAFSVFVEMLNLKLRKLAKPVRLREPYSEG